jgi:hypothetical protein
MYNKFKLTFIYLLSLFLLLLLIFILTFHLKLLIYILELLGNGFFRLFF